MSAVTLRSRSGLALISTLLVVILAAVIITAALAASMTASRTTSAEYQRSRTFYAAEAGAEAALSQLELALQDGVVDSADLENISPPDLSNFDFTGFSITTDGVVQTETITDGPYAGLYSLTQNFVVHSRATDASGAYSGIVLGAKGQAIPIFQFATFFQGGMVDCAGSQKDTWGRAHSNLGFFLCGSDLRFHEVMTTPGGIYRDGFISHEPVGGIGVKIEDASGNEVVLTFDSGDTADPEQFKTNSENAFDGRLRTGAYGVDSLNLPLPDGIAPHELIRPQEDDDTDAEKAVKFAWKADMYVEIDISSLRQKKLVCGGSDQSKFPEITITRPYGGAVPSDAQKCQIFNVTWESFFDNAEEGWVDPVDIDISELRNWMISSGESAQIIYVEIIVPKKTTAPPPETQPKSGVPGDGGVFPIFRVTNGAQLPGPLTLGSEYPLFVQGDYNTIGWQPSALFGDRLAVLSNNWNDNDAANQSDNEDDRNPNADDTTQYFAVITGVGEGNIGCFHEDPGCSTTPPYGGSGWVKLLEDWKACAGGPDGRCIQTMIGSYITLWAPQIASAYGNFPGIDYYRRPVRDYRFDNRFENPDSLPPGTPVVGQVFRAAFRQSY